MSPSQKSRAAEAMRLFSVESRLQPAPSGEAPIRRIRAGEEVFDVPAGASEATCALVLARLHGVFGGNVRLERIDPTQRVEARAASHTARPAHGGESVLAVLKARRKAAAQH